MRFYSFSEWRLLSAREKDLPGPYLEIERRQAEAQLLAAEGAAVKAVRASIKSGTETDHRIALSATHRYAVAFCALVDQGLNRTRLAL
jgi:plasmid replication initiation protein